MGRRLSSIVEARHAPSQGRVEEYGRCLRRGGKVKLGVLVWSWRRNRTRRQGLSYYLYWGKAKPASEGDSCHLLPYHSLDVAAVGWHLLAPERPLTQLLAASLGMPPESLLFWSSRSGHFY